MKNRMSKEEKKKERERLRRYKLESKKRKKEERRKQKEKEKALRGTTTERFKFFRDRNRNNFKKSAITTIIYLALSTVMAIFRLKKAMPLVNKATDDIAKSLFMKNIVLETYLVSATTFFGLFLSLYLYMVFKGGLVDKEKENSYMSTIKTVIFTFFLLCIFVICLGNIIINPKEANLLYFSIPMILFTFVGLNAYIKALMTVGEKKEEKLWYF